MDQDFLEDQQFEVFSLLWDYHLNLNYEVTLVNQNYEEVWLGNYLINLKNQDT